MAANGPKVLTGVTTTLNLIVMMVACNCEHAKKPPNGKL